MSGGELVHWCLWTLLAAAAPCTRPTSASCPPGWSPEGVRPNGETWCRLSAIRGDETAKCQAPCEDIAVVPLRIYCNPSDETRAILVGERSIKCLRN